MYVNTCKHQVYLTKFEVIQYFTHRASIYANFLDQKKAFT